MNVYDHVVKHFDDDLNKKKEFVQIQSLNFIPRERDRLFRRLSRRESLRERLLDNNKPKDKMKSQIITH